MLLLYFSLPSTFLGVCRLSKIHMFRVIMMVEDDARTLCVGTEEMNSI